ncbi:MAG TPA: NAD-dependent epimerase/dehydratase family protein, partial [Candidatus Obscuribacterales bacterium]
VEQGAFVRVASLDDPSRSHPEAEFMQINLMPFENCLKVCQGMDFVFNLLGVKGSPAVTTTKPASFFVPTVTLDTNLMEAARQAGVEGFLFTSSVAVYSPAEVFYEDDVWKTFPSPNDKFAGWAKRMGELQAEAYKIQYGWEKIAIVRPANVYGAYDNFDLENAMVVPSLIKRAVDGENPFIVWGDGSAERDFIHARDVARGMIIAAENADCQPINLGSGVGVSIKQLVETILNNLEHQPSIVWDTSKPKGDRKRIMDISRAKDIGFQPIISLEEGVKEVVSWYRENKDKVSKRYDVFM